jgi:hypothetical protein
MVYTNSPSVRLLHRQDVNVTSLETPVNRVLLSEAPSFDLMFEKKVPKETPLERLKENLNTVPFQTNQEKKVSVRDTG